MNQPIPAVTNVAAVAATRVVKNEKTLPSGVKLVVYKGKGRDIRDAGRIAPIATEKEFGHQLARMALCCTFDGKRLTYEDILEMDSDDVDAAMATMAQAEGKAPEPPTVAPVSPLVPST